MDKYKKYTHIILGLIFLLGLFLRIKLYLFNRSLWLDECFLFENIYFKSFIQMFGELERMQTAPPLFLWIEKFFVICFGIGEPVLRLFPFLCSLCSIPVFYIFSKMFIKKEWSILAANFLFAVNGQLLFYSQEFKQYASDILIFILLFIILNNLTIKQLKKKEIIFFILLSVICPLISLPAYFVIGAWFLRELITYKSEHIKKLLLINIPLLLMTNIYYTTTLVPQQNLFIRNYMYLWEQGFISLNMKENLKLLAHNLQYFFHPCNNWILICGLVIFGILLLIKNYKKQNIQLLFYSMFCILVCSFLKLYPLYERPCLYTLPLLIMLLTKPLDLISANRKFLSAILIIIFLGSFNKYDFSYFRSCFDNSIVNIRFYQIYNNYPNPKELMKILKDNYHNEIVVVNISSAAEYKYYKQYYNFISEEEIYVNEVKKEEEYIQELNKIIKPNQKYVFFFSTDYHPDFIELNGLKKWKDKHKVLFEKDLNKSYLLYLNT